MWPRRFTFSFPAHFPPDQTIKNFIFLSKIPRFPSFLSLFHLTIQRLKEGVFRHSRPTTLEYMLHLLILSIICHLFTNIWKHKPLINIDFPSYYGATTWKPYRPPLNIFFFWLCFTLFIYNTRMHAYQLISDKKIIIYIAIQIRGIDLKYIYFSFLFT